VEQFLEQLSGTLFFLAVVPRSEWGQSMIVFLFVRSGPDGMAQQMFSFGKGNGATKSLVGVLELDILWLCYGVNLPA
jgi:hypothetical protein